MIPVKTMENYIWLYEMISDENNEWHCDHCNHLLPVFVMLVKSRVEINSEFYVKCRKCKHMNKRYRREV